MPANNGKPARTWQLQVLEKVLYTIHRVRGSVVEAGVPPIAPRRAVIPHPNHASGSEENDLHDEWAPRLCASIPQSDRNTSIGR